MPEGNSAGMNINDKKQTRPWLRLCTGALAAGGVAAGTLGLTAGPAQAAPPPAPAYHHHWCPGDHWDNGWGPYQNWNNCRDWDDNYYGGPAGYGPPPWARPLPPPPVGALGPGRVGQQYEQLGILE